ncbi:diguanylate cyclase domain-containing protein [Herbaspirillum rhizosphaerae]|uniref:diguanylate cyclase domain-containing protein n=1 Tax=Herbaspirillum rhizosphaerae TaxID=346179 RepID=UPI00142F36F2|nr:diguanylate cyclase [Herbaspirillum rhizosphaerae]
MPTKILEQALFSKKLHVAEWLALTLCLLLVTSIFLIPAWQERDATIARETERLQEAAQVVGQSLSRSLESTNRAIMNVVGDLPVWRSRQPGWAAASQRLKAYSDAMPSVRSMLIIDANGVVVAQGAIDKVRLPRKITVVDMPFFRTVRDHPDRDTLYVSAPFVSQAGAWTYNVSRAVLTPDGKFSGMVAATIDLEDYKLLLASVRSVDDQFIALIHGQGIQIINEPKDFTPQGMNAAVPGTFFSRHMQSGRSSNVMRGATPAVKTTRIVAMLTLQPAALHMDQALVILAGRDEKTMLNEWHSMIRGRAALLGLIWVLGIAGLWGWQRSRRRAFNEIQLKIRQIDQIFESKLSLLLVLDQQGRCLRISAAWGRLMGWPLHELIGQPIIKRYAHPDDGHIVHQVQHQLAISGVAQNMLCRMRDADGVYHDILGQVAALGGLIYIDARDVTKERQDRDALQELNTQLQSSNSQLKEKETVLLQLAQSDELTDLANRRKFNEELRRAWLTCARLQLPLTLALIDVDHFKQFNDHYGHLRGDQCLQEIARAMRAVVGRPHDLLARYGGEEFVLLLPNTPEKGAVSVLEKLRQTVEDMAMEHADSQTASHITVSIGVATVVPTADASPEVALREADKALYEAKTQGRNRVCFAFDREDS